MAKERIDENSLEALKNLVEKLMAYEARQILVDSGRHGLLSRNFNKRYAIPPKEIKGDILRFFQDKGHEMPDAKLLRDLSLEYLDFIIGFAKNPSYKELKEKIKRGEYNFISALEVNVCS